MGFTEQLVFLYGNSEENTAQLSARLENNNFLVRHFFDLEDLVKASKSEQPYCAHGPFGYRTTKCRDRMWGGCLTSAACRFFSFAFCY